MINITRILIASALFFGSTVVAHAQATPTRKGKPAVSPGERVFTANCSRCHNPPDSLNPRITGTVIRHMRVRANLSAADERDILKFFNP